MTAKENPRRPGSQDGGRKNEQNNCTPKTVLEQVLSGDRDGFETFDYALLQFLAEIATNDPVEYARRKPEAAKQLDVSPYDLDRLVQTYHRKPLHQNNQKFKLIKAKDLTVTPPTWLVHGLIEDDTLGLLFGDSESGKTFLAIDFALCIATGTPFHGKQIIKPGPVIYIIGEGKNGFSRRCLAWSMNKGQDYHDAPFFVSTNPAAFLHPDSTEQVAATVAEVNPVLIVVDTLARNYGPGDENNTADMNKFVSALDYIRRPHKSTMLIIHHTGHGEKDRSRGAYALKCALDFEYRVKREPDGIIIFESTKMKDAEKPEPLAFEPQVIKLIDDDGHHMSSIALELTKMPEKQRTQRISRTQRVALESLKKLLENKDKVHIDEWRTECYAASISSGSAPSAKRVAFSRARTDLLDAGLIETRNDEYWLPLQELHSVTL